MSSWGDEVASSSADGAGSGAGAADARAALKAKVEKLEGTITRLREDIIAAAEDPSKIDKLDRQLTMHEAALTSTKEELAALGPAVDEVSESLGGLTTGSAEEPVHDVTGFSTTNLEVIVEPADKSAPIVSATKFEELNLSPEVLKGVYALGFQKPSPVQEKALPIILGQKPGNLIGQSQTGTGKTAALAIAIMARVDPTKNFPQALVVSPTRELSRSTAAMATTIGQFTGIKVKEAVPELGKAGAVREQVIIGTPGTVRGWITKRHFDPRKITVFVLDEAEQMLETQGFATDSEAIRKMLSASCQIVLFSATFSDQIMKFAKRVVPNPNVITIKHNDLWLPNIKHYLIDCKSSEHRYEVLSTLYGLFPIGQAMIFCGTRNVVDSLTASLVRDNHKVSKTHGGGDAADRDRIFKEFKDTKTKVLVTTNVLSRGIDVAQVNVVINYDPPLTQDSRRAVVPDISSYVHRSGRTGRFGRKGVVINFVYDAKTRKDFAVIEKVAMEKHGAPAAVRIANPDDDAELERVMKSQFD